MRFKNKSPCQTFKLDPLSSQCGDFASSLSLNPSQQTLSPTLSLEPQLVIEQRGYGSLKKVARRKSDIECSVHEISPKYWVRKFYILLTHGPNIVCAPTSTAADRCRSDKDLPAKPRGLKSIKKQTYHIIHTFMFYVFSQMCIINICKNVCKS